LGINDFEIKFKQKLEKDKTWMNTNDLGTLIPMIKMRLLKQILDNIEIIMSEVFKDDDVIENMKLTFGQDFIKKQNNNDNNDKIEIEDNNDDILINEDDLESIDLSKDDNKHKIMLNYIIRYKVQGKFPFSQSYLHLKEDHNEILTHFAIKNQTSLKKYFSNNLEKNYQDYINLYQNSILLEENIMKMKINEKELNIYINDEKNKVLTLFKKYKKVLHIFNYNNNDIKFNDYKEYSKFKKIYPHFIYSDIDEKDDIKDNLSHYKKKLNKEKFLEYKIIRDELIKKNNFFLNVDTIIFDFLFYYHQNFSSSRNSLYFHLWTHTSFILFKFGSLKIYSTDICER
jgi:hypothetical protein